MIAAESKAIDLDFEVLMHLIAGNFHLLRIENITQDLIMNPDVKGFLSFAYDYYQEYGKQPSLTVLEDEFPQHFEEGRSPEVDPDYLADRLRRRYRQIAQRRLITQLTKVDEDEFIPTLNAESKKIHNLTASNDYRASVENFQDIIEYQKQRILEGAFLGSTYGFEEVDDHTGGCRKGHLAILAALPKRGKTWFLIKAFLERIRKGENPVFFTLELSKEDIVGRLLCLLSGVSYNSYYKGTLMPVEWKRLEAAIEEFGTFSGGHIVESPFGNRFVSDFNLEADRLEATSIIVDQFSFIQWAGNHSRENEGYKEIIYDMKNSAIDYDIPWYVAAQFNRTAGESEDTWPTAQQIGLTRAVEEASDLIMALKTNDELREERQVMLGVIEARHCESGPNARWTIQTNFYETTEFFLVR